VTPACCIVLSPPLGTSDSIEVAIEEMGEGLLSMARTAVTALLLYRPGWFIQPELALYMFYAPSLALNIVRAPGPYRQVFASDPSYIPMTRFELKLDELTQEARFPASHHGNLGAVARISALRREFVYRNRH
jgi:hypothetical protein